MQLTVIGAGRIARAIVSGLLAKKVFSPSQIIGTGRSEKTRDTFLALATGTEKLGWSFDLKEACSKADVVLLSVKPVQFSEVLPQLRAENSSPLYISVAAGILLERIEKLLGSSSRIIRAMPNTPVLVGEGVTGYAGNVNATQDDLRIAQTIFGSVGHAFEVGEDKIDHVTALSGSGPAYFYLFVDCLRKAAVERGLDNKIALDMAIQTALGSALMLRNTAQPPADLIDQVKSKGGTTEAALNSFYQSELATVCQKAFDAAWQRSKELSHA